MTVSKSQLASANSVHAALGIAGKVISTVDTYRAGTVEIVDILCTDATHYFIKGSQGLIEVGGTADWGTGTKVGGR
jgi:hypothetical protein